MKHQAVLFDMNGVLIDDEDVQEAAFREVLTRYGFNLTPEDYIRYFIGKTDQRGLNEYAAATGVTYDLPTVMEEKKTAYWQLMARGVHGYDGTEAFIQRLAEQDRRLGVVTSSPRAGAERILTKLGLRSYFMTLITAEDVGKGKPDPEGYLKGATALGVEPEACIVIEDAPSGLAAAAAAHMYSVALGTTHSREYLTTADLIVDRLSAELADRLLAL